MYIKIRRILFALLIILFCSASAYSDSLLEDFHSKFRLLPFPQNIEILGSKGLTSTSLKSVYYRDGAHIPVFHKSLSSLPYSLTKGKGVLSLELTSKMGAKPESYELRIENESVTISAVDKAGLFYGCQTLGQLLEDSRDQHIPIPALNIIDYPDLSYRAVHIDLKHHVDSVNYYYNIIDRLAQFKVNAIIFEFEDKLAYRKAPAVAAASAISIEEFAALSKYAIERNIEISPLVQGLGHASFILKHPQYHHLRDNPKSSWSFDALNPDTYELQFALYEDALAATPQGKYLHVGGDEVGDLGISELARKSGKKPFELQMIWLNKVCDFARRHNRTPIFWDDMLFKLAGLYRTTHDPTIPVDSVEKLWATNGKQLKEYLHLFPKDCVYMRWNYDRPDLSSKAIDWYKSQNLRVMASTSAQTTWAMMPREKSNFWAIQEFCRLASVKNMDGVLCTVWDDASPHFETVWRGLVDFAGLSWKYSDIDADSAHSVFRHRFYGPSLSSKEFNFQDSLEKSLRFWDTALLDKGWRVTAPVSIDLIDLPDNDVSGKWATKYAPRVDAAKHEVERYRKIREKIQMAQNNTVRNRYNLELMRAINELQVFPAKLILLLAEYDSLKSNKKKGAGKKLEVYLDSFNKLRSDFEEVFSVTRILNNPPGYLLDENVHEHLANFRNDASWMHVYELEMIDKTREFLQAENNPPKNIRHDLLKGSKK